MSISEYDYDTKYREHFAELRRALIAVVDELVNLAQRIKRDGRPAWERAGAQLVADVAPFEAMKLRLLNGSHSALAYLGFLSDREFIYQVAADPAFVAYMRKMMEHEVAPTLAVPQGVDAAAVRAADREGRRVEAIEHFQLRCPGHASPSAHDSQTRWVATMPSQ